MSVNKVILIGNVGKEPEVRYVDPGVAVARLTLATTDRAYTLPNGTQVPERTEWHSIVLWRRLAEIVEQYVHKGDKLYIEGRLRTNNYADKQGHTRYVTEIYAETLELLTPRQRSQQPAQPQSPEQAPITPSAASQSHGGNAGNDECPF